MDSVLNFLFDTAERPVRAGLISSGLFAALGLVAAVLPFGVITLTMLLLAVLGLAASLVVTLVLFAAERARRQPPDQSA